MMSLCAGLIERASVCVAGGWEGNVPSGESSEISRFDKVNKTIGLRSINRSMAWYGKKPT